MTQVIPWRRGGTVARDPISSMHQEMDRLFEDFFGNERGFTPLAEGYIAPALDMWETKEALCVKVDIPGMEPKDIEISFSGDVLTIAGEKKQEEITENDTYLVTERRYGSFRRTFRLPPWANTNKIDANYKNGTLELTIGKKEEAKPRNVQVKLKA